MSSLPSSRYGRLAYWGGRLSCNGGAADRGAGGPSCVRGLWTDLESRATQNEVQSQSQKTDGESALHDSGFVTAYQGRDYSPNQDCHNVEKGALSPSSR